MNHWQQVVQMVESNLARLEDPSMIPGEIAMLQAVAATTPNPAAKLVIQGLIAVLQSHLTPPIPTPAPAPAA